MPTLASQPPRSRKQAPYTVFSRLPCKHPDQRSKHWQKPEALCTLYATAPFLTLELIRQGLDMLNTNGSQVVFTATSLPFPIQRAIKLLPNGGVAMFQPEHRMTRSQDLEPAYHDAGQMYWMQTDALLNHVSAFSEQSRPFIMPRHLAQDIDTEED